MTRENSTIDLGLAVSGALLKPGETRTFKEIAAFAGCSTAFIQHLEQKALKKIRNKLMLQSKSELRVTLKDYLS